MLWVRHGAGYDDPGSGSCDDGSTLLVYVKLRLPGDSQRESGDSRESIQTCDSQCLAPRERFAKNQKNPRVHKIRVRNSGAGNGCANFMDACKKCVLSAGKPMSIKFRVLGGFLGGGGGSADFIFMGARIFLKKMGSVREP